jgi:hypothetical protein
MLAFFAAYGLNTVLHECAHALMAHLLGLPSTLFHFYVNIDYPSGDVRTRVLCAIAGPLFSLGLGVVCWVAYRRFQTRPQGLLLLYLSILGTSIFLGNLFSTALVGGDFGVATTQLNLPVVARLAMTLAGGLLLAGFLYRMGQELLQMDTSRTESAANGHSGDRVARGPWHSVGHHCLSTDAAGIHPGLNRKFVILGFRGGRRGHRTEARYAGQASRSFGTGD